MPGVPFQNGYDARRGKGIKGPRMGIAAKVRKRVRDGQDLVNFWAEVFEGTLVVEQIEVSLETGKRVLKDVGPSIKERLDASMKLAHYGFGKPYAAEKEDEPEESPLGVVPDDALVSTLKPVR